MLMSDLIQDIKDNTDNDNTFIDDIATSGFSTNMDDYEVASLVVPYVKAMYIDTDKSTSDYFYVSDEDIKNYTKIKYIDKMYTISDVEDDGDNYKVYTEEGNLPIDYIYNSIILITDTTNYDYDPDKVNDIIDNNDVDSTIKVKFISLSSGSLSTTDTSPDPTLLQSMTNESDNTYEINIIPEAVKYNDTNNINVQTSNDLKVNTSIPINKTSDGIIDYTSKYYISNLDIDNFNKFNNGNSYQCVHKEYADKVVVNLGSYIKELPIFFLQMENTFDLKLNINSNVSIYNNRLEVSNRGTDIYSDNSTEVHYLDFTANLDTVLDIYTFNSENNINVTIDIIAKYFSHIVYRFLSIVDS